MNPKLRQMKKAILIFTLLTSAVMLYSQPTATLSLPYLFVQPAGQIFVPLTVDAISSDVLIGQWYVQYDPAHLTFDHAEQFHSNFPQAEWVIGDVGGETGLNWMGADMQPELIAPGEFFCVLVYTYDGSGTSDLNWGIAKGGPVIKGVTMMWDNTFMEYIMTLENGCIGPGCVCCGNYWTGAVSNEWDNPLNWSLAAVPGPTTDVEIHDVSKAPFPIIGGSVLIGGLTIFPGAQLIVQEFGELTTNGMFKNDGLFHILSDATGNSGSFIDLGGIDPLSIGTFRFDRNTLGTSAPLDWFNWHYISAPVAGVTSDYIWDYYLNLWNEPTSLWVHWEGSPTIPCDPAPTIPLMAMEGWSIKEDANWGTYGCPGGTGQTVELMGPFAGIHTGAYSAAATFTAGAWAGWNFFGNPYPSSIDPSLITWDPNANQSVYYWDGIMNTYMTWAGGVGSWIPPTQGFFTSWTAGGSMAFAGTERAHNTAQFWWKSQVADLLTLQTTAQGNDYADKAYIRFLEEATPEFDKVWDAYKLLSETPGVPQIYTTTTSDMLAINAQPAADMVPMAFASVGSGTFTIEALETSDFADVVLEDLFEGKQTDLLAGSYTFKYTAGDDPNRFIIHFAPLGTPENSINIWSSGHNIYVNVPETANGDIIVFNMMGQEMLRTDIAPGLNVIPMENVNTYYVVKVLTGNIAVTGKVYIK